MQLPLIRPSNILKSHYTASSQGLLPSGNLNLALKQIEDALWAQQDLIDEAEQCHPDDGRDVHTPNWLDHTPGWAQNWFCGLHYH